MRTRQPRCSGIRRGALADMLFAMLAAGLAGCVDSSESADASCRGVAVPCSEFHSIGGCSMQPGCGYDSHNLICTGSAESPCSLNDTAERCLNHAGCDWTAEGDLDAPVCGGGGCSMISDQYSCTSRSDCIWDRATASCGDPVGACACWGTTPTCATYGERSACQGRGGCTWDAGACTGSAWPCEDNPYPDACIVVPGCSWH